MAKRTTRTRKPRIEAKAQEPFDSRTLLPAWDAPWQYDEELAQIMRTCKSRELLPELS
jgi:hypothetical protein